LKGKGHKYESKTLVALFGFPKHSQGHLFISSCFLVMGHIRLGTLAATRRWIDVIELIAEQADASKVAEAVTHAWEHAFNTVRDDVGFREAIWLLSQIGMAGKSANPAEHLNAAGIGVAGAKSVVEVAMGLSEAMENRLQTAHKRSDFGDLAQRALIGAVTAQIQKNNLPLLGSASEDVQGALQNCGREKGFGELSREFFSRMTNECLSYFLSKTLTGQVGEGRRFKNMVRVQAFEDAMRTHCSEASEIVESFSGGWFSKHYFEEGGRIQRDSAEKFGWFGLEKMRRELGERARDYA
jgi:hypothetical protein